MSMVQYTQYVIFFKIIAYDIMTSDKLTSETIKETSRQTLVGSKICHFESVIGDDANAMAILYF